MVNDERKEKHPIRQIALSIAELDMWLDECCKVPTMFDSFCTEIVKISSEDNGYTVVAKMRQNEISSVRIYTITASLNCFHDVILQIAEETNVCYTTNLINLTSVKQLRNLSKLKFSKCVEQINSLVSSDN